MYHYCPHPLELPADDSAPEKPVQSSGVAGVDDDIMESKSKFFNAASGSNESVLIIELSPSWLSVPCEFSTGKRAVGVK